MASLTRGDLSGEGRPERPSRAAGSAATDRPTGATNRRRTGGGARRAWFRGAGSPILGRVL